MTEQPPKQHIPNSIGTQATDAIIAATNQNTAVTNTLVKNYPAKNPEEMDAHFLRAVCSNQIGVFLPTNWKIAGQDPSDLQAAIVRFEKLLEELPSFPPRMTKNPFSLPMKPVLLR